MPPRYKYGRFTDDNDIPNIPRKRQGFRFSYKSWQYLEDIWPRDVRLRDDNYSAGLIRDFCDQIKSDNEEDNQWLDEQAKDFIARRCQGNEAYKIMSVLIFAIRKAQDFAKREGIHLRMEDLFLLFWCQRVEEAKENVGHRDFAVGKPLNIGDPKLLSRKRHRLLKAGLLEFFPGDWRVVRVTAEGKLFMAKMMEDVEQAHRDVKEYVNDDSAFWRDRMEKFLARFCDSWRELDL